MRYLIGALFGLLLALGIAAAFVYFQYEEQEQLSVQAGSSQPASGSNSQNRTPKVTTQLVQIPQSSPPAVSRQPQLYSWKDANGNLVISEHPPKSGAYEKLKLSEQGFSVVEMERVKPLRQKPAQQQGYRSARVERPVVTKQQLLSQNHTHCRWLVGRAYDAYMKIKAHSGNNRSIYCDEYNERLAEMRALSRQGDGCYFPFGYSPNC